MTTPTDDARLADLESRLIFQDDALQALNDALIASQARIDALEKTLRVLVERLASAPSDIDTNDDQPPPHY